MRRLSSDGYSDNPLQCAAASDDDEHVVVAGTTGDVRTPRRAKTDRLRQAWQFLSELWARVWRRQQRSSASYKVSGEYRTFS